MTETVNALVEKFKVEKDYFQKAKILRTLQREHKFSIKQLSEQTTLKPAYVCHILRLNRLPNLVVDGYYGKLVSITHLFILARLKSKAAMLQAYETVLAKNLTSAQTEALVRDMLYGIATHNDLRLSKEEIQDFRREMHELYPGITIKLIQTRIRGRLICELKGDTVFSTKILRGIMSRLLTDDSGIKKTHKNVFVLE